MSKDKKQMIVLGALVLLVLAVGAFQFMGPKPKPAPAAAVKKDVPKDDELVAGGPEKVDPMDEYIKTLMANASSPRDPFAPQAVVFEREPGQQTPVDPPRTTYRPPSEIVGPVIVNPNNGGTNPGTFNGNNTTLVPDSTLKTDGTNGMAFALRAVMIGKTKKLCILETIDGRQILITEGQSFGRNMESTVVEITEEYVVLKHLGKELKLGLNGGN